MRRFLTVPIVALLTLGVGIPQADAGSVNADTTDKAVNVRAGGTRLSSGGGGGGGSGGPVCTWEEVTRGQLLGLAGGAGGPAISVEEQAEQASVTEDGVTKYMFAVSCPGQAARWEFIDTSISVADLAAVVYDEATRTVPLPEHDMNPRPENGSVVNIGLWIAVEEQGVDPITAEAGNAWITANPELTSVTFDPGNGDGPVACDDLGEAYEIGTNNPDQGPCGYTYTERGTFDISVTTTWNVPYDSSDGPGLLDPIDKTETYSYQVSEIQIVGRGSR